MAHFLRKVAIIGFIAMNSPLLAQKSSEGAAPASAVAKAAAVVQSSDARAGSGSLTAAREAAQILAGLDPEMRERLLGATAALAARTAHR